MSGRISDACPAAGHHRAETSSPSSHAGPSRACASRSRSAPSRSSGSTAPSSSPPRSCSSPPPTPARAAGATQTPASASAAPARSSATSSACPARCSTASTSRSTSSRSRSTSYARSRPVNPPLRSVRASSPPAIEQLSVLARGSRWRITREHPAGVITDNAMIGVEWQIGNGCVSSVMRFAPFATMPVTRRAPYVCLAAGWPRQPALDSLRAGHRALLGHRSHCAAAHDTQIPLTHEDEQVDDGAAADRAG